MAMARRPRLSPASVTPDHPDCQTCKPKAVPRTSPEVMPAIAAFLSANLMSWLGEVCVSIRLTPRLLRPPKMAPNSPPNRARMKNIAISHPPGLASGSCARNRRVSCQSTLTTIHTHHTNSAPMSPHPPALADPYPGPPESFGALDIDGQA